MTPHARLHALLRKIGFADLSATVSDAWLHEIHRRGDRSGYDGPPIAFPILKTWDENSRWQTEVLRRQP